MSKPPPRTILEYFCELDPHLLSKLYEDTFTALTIYRSLPQLAKQYVMRALWMAPGQPIPRQTGLDAWVSLDPKDRKSPTNKAHQESLGKLFQLRIFSSNKRSHGKSPGKLYFMFCQDSKLSIWCEGDIDTHEIVLNGNFQACLRRALCYDVPRLQDDSLGPDKRAPSAEVLRQEADLKWEQVLYFIVGAAESSGVAEDIKQQLLQMRLLELRTVKIRAGGEGSDEDESPQGVAYTITQAGYKFLFKSQHAQVWDLILHYLEPENLKKKGLLRHEALQILFKLSFMKVGQDYSREEHVLTPTQQEVLRHLASLGLIYVRKEKERRYYPTHLALNLSSTIAPQSALHQKGFIIVESSFKVYAFTTSRLQLALLKLFCHLLYELPNMVAGIMTKATIRRAFKKNISAQEIIDYLEQHLHPQCRAPDGSPAIEQTIKDQIRLWESERNRLVSKTRTHLCEQFSSAQFSEARKWLAKYPEELLWFDPDNRILVLTDKGKQILKSSLQPSGASADRPTIA
eukprot:g34080.t1